MSNAAETQKTKEPIDFKLVKTGRSLPPSQGGEVQSDAEHELHGPPPQEEEGGGEEGREEARGEHAPRHEGELQVQLPGLRAVQHRPQQGTWGSEVC